MKNPAKLYLTEFNNIFHLTRRLSQKFAVVAPNPGRKNVTLLNGQPIKHKNDKQGKKGREMERNKQTDTLATDLTN